MSENKALLELSHQYGAKNYLPLPVVLNRGEKSRVWDVDGKEYLDFLSCYSALNFGHQPPAITEALTNQLKKLSVCSRAFESEELCYFVKELSEFCGMQATLPMNSGTEAVETAIKVARKWAYLQKNVPENKAKIITMKNNFHGRSVTVVSFSTEQLYREGFGPYTPGFELAEFDNLDAVANLIDENTAAILSEPIQAEAGIIIPQPQYMANLKKLCKEKNVLLMWDEIQTGLGRTGKDFCFQHEEAKPDVLILGKSLGGGILPLSAVVTSRDIMDGIQPGEHGSTFGGNPLACAVGRAAIKTLRDDKLSERSSALGEKVMAQLSKVKSSRVTEIRGKGLLIGIELDTSARPYCESLAEKGVLCKETHDNVIRIAPPLVISEADLEAGVASIVETLESGP